VRHRESSARTRQGAFGGGTDSGSRRPLSIPTSSWLPPVTDVQLASTGWQADLARHLSTPAWPVDEAGNTGATRCPARSVALPGSIKIPVASRFRRIDPPGVVSMRFDDADIRTTSVVFGDARSSDPGGGPSNASDLSRCAPRSDSCPPAATAVGRLVEGATRIRPPRDVIKLDDRLYYLLQPPLESLLSQASLRFPSPPYPYQLQGVAFLYPRYGAVLADEMGLGKTMQAITAIRLLVWRREIRRVLLIAPKPLVSNWQREFALWAPELSPTLVEGHPVRRRWLWQLPEAVITIANYELALRDADLLASDALHFDLVVLDEAQRIKNRGGATSRAICRVTRQRSWALTGTPVENGTEDLVGIFEFLAPGYLRADLKPRRMGHAVSDFVLRRTKDEVLADLPPKLLRDADLELTAAQRASYHRAEDEGLVRLTELGADLKIQHVLELILRLKQICNFDPVTGASAKLERLLVDLEECAASGRKAIVFSQWVRSLTALRDGLDRFRPLEYHGRIPRQRREAVLDQFRRDRDHHVLLMSYGAGGVGLNLQLAGYVFLFDRWWNPAVEDQAISRAHRIGTAGPVVVTRFLTRATIEERINQILNDKRALFDAIFSGTRPKGNLGLTQDELLGLFSPRPPITPARRAG